MPEAAERAESAAPNAVFEKGADLATLRLTGSWRLASLARIAAQLEALQWPEKFAVDGSGVTEIDSAGALALLTQVDAHSRSPPQLTGFQANELRIVEQVRGRLEAARAPTRHHQERTLEMLGRRTIEVALSVVGDINFLGATVVGLGRSVIHP
nr:hypothetical protein [Burkholderiaceae bacterium]